ncbi:DUF2573 family protein [Paenibacillus sp. y28]|uniref:DUF2573 family protein n=1 Tax=Paenibacillus sp. y28 TaxID=3129110 RepID=UPI00301A9E40
MTPEFDKDFDALVEKFAELLTGDTSPQTIDMVVKWSIYNHIHKTMPALTGHWGQHHPESKKEVRQLFQSVIALHNEHRAKQDGEAEPAATGSQTDAGKQAGEASPQ